MEAAIQSSPSGVRREDRSLMRLNVVVGLVHLAQAIVIVAIAGPARLPVNINYMTGPPGASAPNVTSEVFTMRIDLAVGLFLLLAAIDHLAVSLPGIRDWYLRNVRRGINPARWWEYSISASVMVVLIAMLTGISELTALVAIFGANAAMILFGLVMEYTNVDRPRVQWRPFVYGCIVGAVPWIAIALQLGVAGSEAGGEAPAFVYVIFATLFVLFNLFALNMWLQYRGVGRWADPVFAEKAYLWLSLIAKSALAWQVYFGALAGS
jgi:Heliorhodopsin